MQVGKTEYLCSLREVVRWGMQQGLYLNGVKVGKHSSIEQIEEMATSMQGSKPFGQPQMGKWGPRQAQ